MKTVFIQNLITPYRSRLFNIICSKSKDFGVYYMGLTEADRNWDPNNIDVRHAHWIDRFGLYFMFRGLHIHINPCLVFKILFSKNIKNVILGVSYCDLNILFLAFCKHLHLTRKTFYMWSEANYLTNGSRKSSRLKDFLRRFLYGAVDGGVIVPGQMAKMSFEKWGIKINRYIDLPNTINDEQLSYEPLNRSDNALPLFVFPVRLDEKIKGVLNFFNAIGLENIKKAKFVIAGDGPDKQRYQDYICDNKLEDHISLAGFLDSSQLSALYNQANAMVLPSYSDSSPLSLVEGLYFHLPILCSNYCGNNYETVDNGKNGYTFSPFEPLEIKQAFENFMSRKDEWAHMGEISAQKYEHFNVDTLANRIIQELS